MHQNSPKSIPFYKTPAFIFVIYWAVLVAWQNISDFGTRSSLDMVVKMALLVFFMQYFLRRAHGVSKKISMIFFLCVPLLITVMAQESFSVSNMIAYIYPVVFLTMVYGIGDKHEIRKSNLLTFGKWVIAITLYAAVYAIIFKWDQFARALSLSNAYGNELTSFFISNHEYGLYLVGAMISCLLCLQMQLHLKWWKKIIYIVFLLIFGANLILTFSRTSLYALAIIIALFTIFGRGGVRKWMIGIVVVGGVLVLCVPALRSFVYEIVLKKNYLASREVMYANAVRYYQNGSLPEKLFGHGITNAQQYFESTFEHSGVHNAYLQILLYYGFAGFLFLLGFLLTQLIAAVRLVRKDRFMGAMYIGLIVGAAAMMFTNTMVVFTSPIDSYFLTIFMFIVPKYVRNAINNGTFDDEVVPV